MGIISWIVVGAIAGILAGFFVTGDEGLGIIGRILLGIVGAVVGGFIAGLLLPGSDYITGINLGTIIVATIGEGLTLGRVMGPQWGAQPPCAVANPIFVDVDGDGFQPNGDQLDLPLPLPPRPAVSR